MIIHIYIYYIHVYIYIDTYMVNPPKTHTCIYIYIYWVQIMIILIILWTDTLATLAIFLSSGNTSLCFSQKITSTNQMIRMNQHPKAFFQESCVGYGLVNLTSPEARARGDTQLGSSVNSLSFSWTYAINPYLFKVFFGWFSLSFPHMDVSENRGVFPPPNHPIC